MPIKLINSSLRRQDARAKPLLGINTFQLVLNRNAIPFLCNQPAEKCWTGRYSAQLLIQVAQQVGTER